MSEIFCKERSYIYLYSTCQEWKNFVKIEREIYYEISHFFPQEIFFLLKALSKTDCVFESCMELQRSIPVSLLCTLVQYSRGFKNAEVGLSAPRGTRAEGRRSKPLNGVETPVLGAMQSDANVHPCVFLAEGAGTTERCCDSGLQPPLPGGLSVHCSV